MSRIAVIGIGNVLTGDDGVGPTIVRVLDAGYDLGPDVEVIAAGTPGLDLTAYMADVEAIVIVDAVKARGAPGDLRTYDKEELMKKSPVLAMSPHEPGVREALLNADFMGVAPRTFRLVGVIPESVELGCALSAAVEAAVPRALAQVLDELRALGVAPRERVPPRAPDLWWTRKPEA
ncbi:hydrogenase maturation protease [Anaeromyxobacter oryzae]|uniref:Hydrogenase 2 maturation endopeptidase n=1 Tax=Anaeromyxobacter oryzae TaxID=2918170 RepID=A0ABN6MT33_9BACT|nr:hydrogenase maturation protease [Anaeromyxobacter oryzae]BDG04114.1 hydrogenase 2 maturation endopeptidase [Anaeromyxobacter oryzae]